MSNASKTVLKYTQDASSNSFTTSYDQIAAALGQDVREIEVYNGTSAVLILAQGASGAEVEICYILPGTYVTACMLNKGARLAVKGLATVSSGILAMNFKQ